MTLPGWIPRVAVSLLVPCLIPWCGGAARGDVLELNSGGRIEGRLVDDQESDAKLVIETTAGVRMTISRDQVERVNSPSEAEVEYEALAHGSPDTVDAHWKLVQWCRARDLSDQADQHLARILELDPDHAEARRLLGFRQENGGWMTREELMASRGLVYYDGRYVTRQHVELMEREKQRRATDVEWNGRLDRLRRWLVSRRADRAEQARQELLAIDDPAAAEAIVDMLRQEKDPAVRQVWITVASQVDHPATIDALVQLSLYDPDEETSQRCLEYLLRSQRPGLATPYIRALRNRDNAVINRAATALGHIGDTTAINPLIDVLVTKHKFQVSSGNPEQYAFSFTPTGGSGFSFGGGGPKIVIREVRNPAVLSALVKLSGGTSFEYDKDQWRTWLAAQAKLDLVDVRRDE